MQQHVQHGAARVEESLPTRPRPGPSGAKQHYTTEELHALKPAKCFVSRDTRHLLFKLNLWHKIPCKNRKPQLKLSTKTSPLTTIKPNTVIKSTTHINVNLSLINVRSIRCKSGSLVDKFLQDDLDICLLTETWLRSQDQKIRSDLNVVGCLFRDSPRNSREGGGVGLLCKSALAPEHVSSGEERSFEHAAWNVSLNKRKFTVAVIYRPPYSARHPVSTTDFFTEFASYLESLLSSAHPVIIAGDFNIHVDDPESHDGQRLIDLLESFSLTQHVDFPTHTSDHTLDLVITRSADAHIIAKCQQDSFFSDHCFVKVQIRARKPALETKTIKYRSFKSIDTCAFQRDISSSPLCSPSDENTNVLASLYYETLSQLRDKHAPEKTKTVTIRPKQSWYSAHLLTLKRQVRKAERAWSSQKAKSASSTTEADQWSASLRVSEQWFRDVRKGYYDEVEKAKSDYYTTKVEECGSNQRKLYQVIHELAGEKTENPLPSLTNLEQVAGFSEFFCKKIEGIRQDIDNTDAGPPPTTNRASVGVSLSSFKPLTEEEVAKIIQQSPSKQCVLDPCPTYLVKQYLNDLLPFITITINSSLESATFPESWKCAIVKPLLKKSGLECIYKNYRPVSNLPFLSKVCEKSVISRLREYVEENDLAPIMNSAYRAHHSTETALLKVQTDIMNSMASGHVTLLVMLDLSAAFDTIDHLILNQTLSDSFGIHGNALRWIESYLHQRRQQVSIDGAMSDPADLYHGVPQGSCLGPILFTLYLAPLYDVIKNHLPDVHGYADDNQLYLSFAPGQPEQDAALSAMEACIRDVRAWMLHNKLKINDSKTEVIVIGTQHGLSKVSIDGIAVGNDVITPVDCVKNLGVIFDSNLSHNRNINNITSKAHRQLYNLRQIRKNLNLNTTQSLVHALITSHLDYCNSLLLGTTDMNCNKLQLLQNAAARLIVKLPKFEHITSTLVELHWLPIKHRILFKVLLIVYKALHGLAPAYIQGMLEWYVPGRALRSEGQCQLVVRDARGLQRPSLTDRSFYYRAPLLWNDLPLPIRLSSSVNIFKTSLKTHLFKIAYHHCL